MIIMEHNRISIKYYETIILLENNIIEVKMKDKYVKIVGKDLQVSYYTSIEIIVHGDFKNITFSWN